MQLYDELVAQLDRSEAGLSSRRSNVPRASVAGATDNQRPARYCTPNMSGSITIIRELKRNRNKSPCRPYQADQSEEARLPRRQPERPAIDATFVALVAIHFQEFHDALEGVIDALALIRHGHDRSRLSEAAVDDLEDEARDLAWDFQDADEDDITARFQERDTTALLVCLRHCHDVCLKAADSYCAMTERH
jgi:hypothetical protein